MKKQWNVAKPCPLDFAKTFSEKDAFLAQLLWNRGIRTPEEIEDFLQPSWEEGCHDPSQFRQMRPALDRIFAALEAGERITVHGDYDADGVTGSTVLITTLRHIASTMGQANALIDYYIPHRDKEGYGLHTGTVPKLKERGTKVIVTVDCGIASVEEIGQAREADMDVIVVDHHQFGDVLPDAHLIHPGLPEETYPFKHLAAVGVAYKFATMLLAEARSRDIAIMEGWEKWLLDLVAIATVTDMVPLIGENRVLETYGLKVLNKTRRPGLLALIREASLPFGSLTTEDIGFGIGPRLNAAGRMDHAEIALRLLLSESSDEARQIADDIERLNRSRQEVTRGMMKEAEAFVASADFDSSAKAFVLWNRDWSPSLVGLVAGRFLEKFWRPVIVIGQHDPHWIGSGRSIPEYDITAGVKRVGEGILTRSGGHPRACGFALTDSTKLVEFRKRLAADAEEQLGNTVLKPSIDIDAELPLSSVQMETCEQLARLEPHGMGNTKPVFLARHCKVQQADTMGKLNQHLRVSLFDERGRKVKAIAFREGPRVTELANNATIDLVYTISVNEWNGRKTAECRIVDFVRRWD